MSNKKKSLLLVGLLGASLVIIFGGLLTNVQLGAAALILLVIGILCMVVVAGTKITEWQQQDQMALIQDALDKRLAARIAALGPPKPSLCPSCLALWNGAPSLSRTCDRIDCTDGVSRCISLTNDSMTHVWLCATHYRAVPSFQTYG